MEKWFLDQMVRNVGLVEKTFWPFAYDVPIPGYKTKTTGQQKPLQQILICLHITLASIPRQQKLYLTLSFPNESNEGKALRLKQQYTLCSASLQDIIARFETRSGGSVSWEEFPEKVAVQMNDTHPTLCTPELMSILIDLKGLSWEDAWKITQRVLPEALEKWSLELMEKFLPCHVEIYLVGTIVSEYGTADPDLLQEKLIKAMMILENFELPSAFADVIVKPQNKPVIAENTVDQSQDSKEDAQTARAKAEEVISEPARWTRMSIILNTAGSSKFSSDRTIHEYAKDIWNIKQVELPCVLTSLLSELF
ncbi:hypothetical protein YC2023_079740 [Brassica napus]